MPLAPAPLRLRVEPSGSCGASTTAAIGIASNTWTKF
jgi:hypothetical protein